MKKLNNYNLDVYLYLKEYIKENKYTPTYREIVDNTNYKSIGSIKEALEKLEELGFIKAKRSENGNLITKSIKVIDDKNTKKQIEELRSDINVAD